MEQVLLHEIYSRTTLIILKVISDNRFFAGIRRCESNAAFGKVSRIRVNSFVLRENQLIGKIFQVTREYKAFPGLLSALWMSEVDGLRRAGETANSFLGIGM